MNPFSFIQVGMSLKKGYDWLTTKTETSRDHTLYDPIATIISIALLPYKEKKTRIKVAENRLILQQPKDYTYVGFNFQWAFRLTQGDKREDLMVIEPLVFRAANILKPKTTLVAQKLFFKCAKGLKRLEKATYNELKDRDKMMRKILTDWRKTVHKAAVVGLKDHNLTNLDEKIKSIWSEKHLQAVFAWLTDAETAREKKQVDTLQKNINKIEKKLDKQHKRFIL